MLSVPRAGATGLRPTGSMVCDGVLATYGAFRGQQVSMPFDRVVVIFNPQSTGQAPQLAEELTSALAERLPSMPVQLHPTEHAGHARDLAAHAGRTGLSEQRRNRKG